ncbi:MAG: MFS transporter, partial [Oligoflexia bacterium]|nr:MFS transporter [Oligoflexia bacterium]
LAGALCMFWGSMATTFTALFISRLFAGIFGANISTATAYITDITSSKDRAKGMGIIGAGFGLGFIFGPAIGGIFSTYSYSTPLLLASILGIANFILAFFILEESFYPEKMKSERRKLSLKNFRMALHNPKSSSPIFLFFLSTLSFTHVEVIFALYVLQKFNYSAQNAGWILAAMGLIGAFLQGGMIGKLVKRFSELRLINTAFILLTLSLALSAFAESGFYFVLCLLGIAIANGILNPCLSSTCSKAIEPDKIGSVMGVYQSAGSLSRILGPPIAGFLFDHSSARSPIFLSATIAATAFLFSYLLRDNLRDVS